MSEFDGTGLYKDIKKAEEEFSDIFTKATTAPSNIIENNTAEIVTITVVIVGIIVAIVGLFGMALFIDCRQLTLDEDGQPKRSLRLRIPRFLRRNADDDINPITDQIENENRSTEPPTIVIQSATANMNYF